jgi:hypothetical protein
MELPKKQFTRIRIVIFYPFLDISLIESDFELTKPSTGEEYRLQSQTTLLGLPAYKKITRQRKQHPVKRETRLLQASYEYSDAEGSLKSTSPIEEEPEYRWQIQRVPKPPTKPASQEWIKLPWNHVAGARGPSQFMGS